MPAAELLDWILMAAAIGFAALVHGTLGIGFPLVSTPLLALMTDVRSAVVITLIPTVTVNLLSIFYGGDWRRGIARHWPLVATIPLGCAIGSWMLIHFDPSPFRLALAAMIGLYLAEPWLRGDWLHYFAEHRWQGYLLFGMLAGIAAGTVNVMVPVLVLFALQLALPRDAMIQLFNLCFMSGKLTQMLVFGQQKLIGLDTLTGYWPLALVAGVVLLLGMQLRRRIAAETYRRWLRYLLMLMAAVLIGQFVSGA